MPYKLPSGILVYRFGERGSGYKPKTAGASAQDYEKLKKQLVAKNELFEDPEFPIETAYRKRLEWLRPTEIDPEPRFFVGGASRFDVKQGELGNCWLLAAVANLTMNPKLFFLIVPEDNSFVKNYAGIFHFRFWKFGRWVDVVIDDRLPTRDGKLIFMRSVEKNEFWSALIEKAYAKMHGSYQALIGGNVCEALEDFTGGFTEMCLVAESPKNLFQVMCKAHERSSFMGCSIDAEESEIEAEGPMGLIKGHAYSITDIKSVEIKTMKEKAQLVRIRNPWGNDAEWSGAWSDGSPEWNLLKGDTINEFDLKSEADGEFWMCYDDFTKYFQQLDICNLGPDVLDEMEEEQKTDDNKNQIKRKRWVMNAFDGSWVRGVTAGGCRMFLDSFSLNPQYIVELTDADDEDDDDECTIIIALMQKNRRKLGKDYLTIGYIIYLIKDPENTPKPLNKDFFKYTKSVAVVPDFIDAREISCRFKLPPGTYCIVPSTYEPNEEGEYILRVFTETPNVMKENDEEISINDEEETERLIAQLENMTDLTGGNKNKGSPGKTKVDEKEAQKAQDFFGEVAGEDLEVSWEELKGVLDATFTTEFGFDGFSKDICRSMISMLDADRSGKLGFDEFQLLWKNVETWKNVFKKFDVDNSGTLSSFELRDAMNASGFRVNNKVLQSLVLRYGNKDGCLFFDDFIMCAIKLKCMVETFKEKLADGEKAAYFTLDEWVEKTLYC